jgi:hypothetical protein
VRIVDAPGKILYWAYANGCKPVVVEAELVINKYLFAQKSVHNLVETMVQLMVQVDKGQDLIKSIVGLTRAKGYESRGKHDDWSIYFVGVSLCLNASNKYWLFAAPNFIKQTIAHQDFDQKTHPTELLVLSLVVIIVLAQSRHQRLASGTAHVEGCVLACMTSDLALASLTLCFESPLRWHFIGKLLEFCITSKALLDVAAYQAPIGSMFTTFLQAIQKSVMTRLASARSTSARNWGVDDTLRPSSTRIRRLIAMDAKSNYAVQLDEFLVRGSPNNVDACF